MSKVAFVFPGQGSQTVGMGKDIYEASSSARAIFEQANEALGEDLTRLCFEGPSELLMLTENTQPAILTVSVACYAVLNREPDVAAGHSLGEYSALVAAGVLHFADAVKLVRLRGRFMQEAVPQGQGAMYAVVGSDNDELQQAIDRHGEGLVDIANYNSPKQLVISGAALQVQNVVKALTRLRALKLPVSAPFHSRLMLPAAKRLRAELQKFQFAEPRFPVIRNVDAALITTAEQARDGLCRQVDSPVRWTESIQNMICNRDVSLFIEIGPGKVLTGLINQIVPTTDRLNLQSLKDLESISAKLDGLS